MNVSIPPVPESLLESVVRGWRALSTRLVQLGRDVPEGGQGLFVNPPVTRGSTVLFSSLEAMETAGRNRYDHELIYGAMGTPVQYRLEQAVAAIEGGTHAQVVPSGLAACTLPLLAYLEAGDHCLLSDSVYGPTRRFAEKVLRRFGVETSYFPPMADEAALRALIRPDTRVIFAESPGSHSFEVQDVALLARLARGAGARLVVDNTWGIGLFSPLAHGAHASVQALTKYAAGHSDAIIGAVSVADPRDWQPLRDAAIQMGQLAGPDDCWLTLRGLRTMGARQERQAASALAVALWLQGRPEVARVLHPALPSCPGHDCWKRDFSGASSLFGVVFDPGFDESDLTCMIDGLTHFGIGASWGGYESLVLPTTGGITRAMPSVTHGGVACRLHIGLEAPEILVADLARGLDVMSAARQRRAGG
ncbi:Putative cystathionine beta-lyase [Gluconacetobacter sp. SXCC-1]|uniref:Cystathionine beta-lyase n=2 Tax=Komagataeibacter rhaeticus TaxID=215221 RepID=A0A181CBE5_9PROT|nr:cystathionine beta-lyase [Komagataeibacter rhaeticus]ATU72438.1 cystathionine beta-lyase [Komagataeibacter xylinus]EGG74743.1 Putative cystathionine beta-lyase [Gluconacetobacter sp. SXCC-1]QIP35651.1 cystathionine beta-lyase [Komagataeibacter rhaeticus]QOC45406.1 cystathionine beta-lyase [Komagataeibacter rhaeticus]WPP22183.1 cystathionine beta-lyase [Komagataeibacter rhaeticus]